MSRALVDVLVLWASPSLPPVLGSFPDDDRGGWVLRRGCASFSRTLQASGHVDRAARMRVLSGLPRRRNRYRALDRSVGLATKRVRPASEG